MQSARLVLQHPLRDSSAPPSPSPSLPADLLVSLLLAASPAGETEWPPRSLAKPPPPTASPPLLPQPQLLPPPPLSAQSRVTLPDGPATCLLTSVEARLPKDAPAQLVMPLRLLPLPPEDGSPAVPVAARRSAVSLLPAVPTVPPSLAVVTPPEAEQAAPTAEVDSAPAENRCVCNAIT